MSASLLILARAFHFGSGMLLVGVVAFRWLVLLPAFVGEADETWQKFAPLFHRLQALFLWSGVILVLSGAALFWAVAAEMSGASLIDSLSPDTLRTVLFQTQFGSVCQWRIGLAVILAVMMWRLARNQWQLRRKLPRLEISAGLVATALVVSIAWTGHAAAAGGSAFYGRVLADALHLVAASVWPTGLLPFALFLGCARHADDVSRRRPVLAATRRFSAASFFIVWMLIITGIINTCFIVGSFQALVFFLLYLGLRHETDTISCRFSSAGPLTRF
jgi:putative copper resistance protein D